MHVAPRSYLTAGIAVLGAGAIAVAPVQPVPTQVALDSHRVVTDLGIDLLASSIDPITPWVNAFETAGANIGTLFEFYLQKPFPLLQTIGANWATYIEEIGNGQGALIPEQIWNNVVTFFEAPWSPGTQFKLTGATTPPTPLDVPLGQYLSETEPVQSGDRNALSPKDANNTFLQFALSAALTPDNPANLIPWSFFLSFGPVWNFLNTNYSGQLLGLLGPLISPIVQLTKSFTAIGEFFEAGDVVGAINELINIPANMTNAFLNGAGFLDLTGILSSVFEGIPEGAQIGANLGGLLNSMPLDGSLNDPNNPPTTWSGGTGFDSLALNLSDTLPTIPGLPNGWAGSVVGLGQFLGEQLLVTPPAPPTQAAAEPEAAELAAPVDVPAAPVVVDDAAPAVVEVADPVTESDPVVVEEAAEEPAPVVVAEVEEAAPADIDVAEIEAAVAEVEAEVAEVEAPAAAEDNGPAEARGSDDSGDTGSRATDSRRGAASED